MSKKATDEKQQQPAYVEELLKNGTAVLTAKTREELADMVNDIPANVRYGAGAAGYNPETGAFTLRVDIIND
jgi:hypothetical protein